MLEWRRKRWPGLSEVRILFSRFICREISFRNRVTCVVGVRLIWHGCTYYRFGTTRTDGRPPARDPGLARSWSSGTRRARSTRGTLGRDTAARAPARGRRTQSHRRGSMAPARKCQLRRAPHVPLGSRLRGRTLRVRGDWRRNGRAGYASYSRPNHRAIQTGASD